MSLTEAKPIEAQENGELADQVQAVINEAERLLDRGEYVDYKVDRARTFPYQDCLVTIQQSSDIFRSSEQGDFLFGPTPIPSDKQIVKDEWFDQKMKGGEESLDYIFYTKDSGDHVVYGGVLFKPNGAKEFVDLRDDQQHFPDEDDYTEARESFLTWLAENLKDHSTITSTTSYRPFHHLIKRPSTPNTQLFSFAKLDTYRNGCPASGEPENYYVIQICENPDKSRENYTVVWVDLSNNKAYAQGEEDLGSRPATVEELNLAAKLLRDPKANQ